MYKVEVKHTTLCLPGPLPKKYQQGKLIKLKIHEISIKKIELVCFEEKLVTYRSALVSGGGGYISF